MPPLFSITHDGQLYSNKALPVPGIDTGQFVVKYGTGRGLSSEECGCIVGRRAVKMSSALRQAAEYKITGYW